MPHTPPATELLSLLRQELAAVQAFVGLLQAEQHALIRGDIDGLPPLTQQKTDLAQTIATSSNARLRWLALHALPNSGPSMQRWFKNTHPDLETTWQHILTEAAQAQQINQQNGQLIATRQQLNQAALQSLSGNTQLTAIYGRDGLSDASGPGRSLGKA